MRGSSAPQAGGGASLPQFAQVALWHFSLGGGGVSFGEQSGAANPASLLTTVLAPPGRSCCPSRCPRGVSVQCGKLCDKSVHSCDGVWFKCPGCPTSTLSPSTALPAQGCSGCRDVQAAGGGKEEEEEEVLCVGRFSVCAYLTPITHKHM